VTFSGSVIAFGKLSAKISGKPLLIPARHWINLRPARRALVRLAIRRRRRSRPA
jgi:NAD/NADP transhydrogenase beta subunit